MSTPPSIEPASRDELLARYASYDGLVFDFDGTLVDTMPAHYKSWVTVMSRHGITFEEDTFYAWGGRPTQAIVEDLAEAQGVDLDPVAVSHEKEDHFAEFGMIQLEPVEPVFAIAEAHRGVKPMAIATGGHRRIIEQAIASLGWSEGWFDALVTADDVQRHKPDPQTFSEAARRIGVDPTRCVGFEDSDPGLASARGAGMMAIDVRPMRKR